MRHPPTSPGAIAKGWRLLSLRAAAFLLLVVMGSGASFAYSVLTHEEIVDLLWSGEIRPLLLKRYPGLSEDQIKEAHAYAYGGAVIQDLGYYPFGSTEFSNLVHYVRSGDFVRELLLESQDANEYAFALGALSHYASDIAGHPAVNQAVAVAYPKLRAKFGQSVRYAQDKTAHLKTEFGFDTLQVAKNRYASQQYHDFIGFLVSKPLLERAFPVVYAVELKNVLNHEDLAVGSYDFSVNELMANIRHFKGLVFNNPTPQTEDMYIKNINTTVDQYRAFLEQVRTDTLVLPNCDFDTGQPTKAAEYSLTDDAYAKLLGQLSSHKFERTTPELRANILDFYSDLAASFETKKDQNDWKNVLTELDQLKALTPGPAVAASPAR